ncbi:stemmadenine O-acetyltransferase-like [Salvia miltiorrhiza]|uniref:stemmadenine O-acetyltransferase-like n=1 Tax=Salvia miltiorrhiza TaxID=226208 RepID=UPI0025AB9519|nr:stemmadenine O-acetyltransferase-like [Salvia miltiorrhiza]
MAIKVEIISHEMIKPSSPTPTHLRNLKLSFLDQIAPPIYVPLIFFYNHHQLTLQNLTHHQISQLLKQSLSKTLTVFYPLAGRIHENSSIDCNDSGAEFIEARVHTRALSEILQEPSMEELKKLQPVEILGQDEKVVLKVKICFFDCGGISVAICLSHKIADGTSLVAFVNAWAASSRGEPQNFRPSFDFASVFPPRDLSGLDFTQRIGMTEERIATKRLVFDKEELAKLRNSESSQVKNPTRVEAVSSYIWRRFMDAAKDRGGGTETASFAAVHAVNLRPRKSPPFPQHMFGNCWRPAIAVMSGAEGSDEGELVGKLRAAITRIDGDFIRQVENGEYLNVLSRSVDLFMKGGVEFCNFSSWCRFPVYEVDFGWGKPVWVCTTALPFKNLVILMSTPCGEGIEAWVNVVEEDG